jgi:hypothetical protein
LATTALTSSEIKLKILRTSSLSMSNGRTTKIGMGDNARGINDRDKQTLRNVTGNLFSQLRVASSDCLPSSVNQQRMWQSDMGE